MLQALSDPYCQSMCLSETLMLNISETKRFRVCVQQGAYRKMPTVHLLVMSTITSPELYNDILLMSQSSKSTHSENRTQVK